VEQTREREMCNERKLGCKLCGFRRESDEKKKTRPVALAIAHTHAHKISVKERLRSGVNTKLLRKQEQEEAAPGERERFLTCKETETDGSPVKRLASAVPVCPAVADLEAVAGRSEIDLIHTDF
jgi:hypothetical protein